VELAMEGRSKPAASMQILGSARVSSRDEPPSEKPKRCSPSVRSAIGMISTIRLMRVGRSIETDRLSMREVPTEI
jgi:hypothetical protein